MKQMLWVLAALLTLMLPAQAQGPGGSGAKVVTTCGTLPNPYSEGQTQALTQDVNGNLCGGGAGGSGAVTIADCADIAEGCKADAAWVSGSGSVISILKNIASGVASAIAAGTNYIGQVEMSTLQSGVQVPVKGCDTHAFYDASDNGKKTVVAGVTAKKIYVCGFILATGGSATNLSLTSGTGVDCVSTSTAITPAYQLVANDRVGANSSFWNGLVTLANADNLCVNASAGNAHQAEIWYTIQ